MATSPLRSMARAARSRIERLRLPHAAKAEAAADRRGLGDADPGIDATLDAAAAWLLDAQQHSPTDDGGVAHHYSLISGWAPSYPETTGYIVPTLLDWARLRDRADARAAARRMLDWLVSIQFESGAFQGGSIDAPDPRPVAFNTGQILMGLARGVREWGEAYREPMRRAADWLVAIQDADGCWRKGASPFARAGDHSYDVHLAWGLLEAARLEPDRAWGASALANARWALSRQQDDGWMLDVSQGDPGTPATHPIGYVMKGFLEAYRHSGDPAFLDACRRMADGILGSLGSDGFIPGQLRAGWRPAADWSCLTGTVQIADVWLSLYEETGEARYLEAGRLANRYVRRTLKVEAPPGVRGGVKGSFPVDGAFRPFDFPNWAAKFFIDSHLTERALRDG